MMFTEASKRYLNIWAFKLLEVIASREWNYPSFSLSTLQISTVKFYNSIRSSVTNKNDINFKNMFEFMIKLKTNIFISSFARNSF